MLALSWLRSLRARFPDGRLYAGLGAQSPGGAPADPMEILGRFLRALGVPPQRIPAAVDERTDLYRSLTAERRLVVLLDDAATAAQARPPAAGRTECGGGDQPLESSSAPDGSPSAPRPGGWAHDAKGRLPRHSSNSSRALVWGCADRPRTASDRMCPTPWTNDVRKPCNRPAARP